MNENVAGIFQYFTESIFCTLRSIVGF